MRKLTFLLACLLMVGIGLVNAQTKSITGKVISAEDGQPVIGAAVKVKGAKTAAITNLNGDFTISAESGQVLVISFVGMKVTESAAKSNMVITLQPDSKVMNEVVITAMGIPKSKKAIGYSAAAVSGDEIAKNRTSDVMSSLSGRVAGVQISSTSSDPGTSTSVVIRGFSSLTGSNQPLYVIDGVPMSNNGVKSNDELNSGYDFGSGANAVNPDDVESMTILKGSAATALYGSRAANGVIVITTKSGKKQQKGVGVEYNGGVQMASVLRLPELQNKFGMGWNGNHTMIENGSWGPKLDGSMQLFGNIYNNSQKVKSYSALANNLRDFFDTGLRYSNSLSFNGASDKSDYFVSFSQLSDNGILPTDADTYDRYTFSMRGSHTVGKIKVSSSINYETQINNFATTGQGFSMINSLYQTPRDISIVGLKDLSDPFNTPGYYYTPYGVTNPYYVLENYQREYKAEKIYGKLQFDYSILDHLKFTYRAGLDATNGESNSGSPNLKALFAGSPNISGNLEKEEGNVEVLNLRQREINQDFLLMHDVDISDFSINSLLGFNINERRSSLQSSSVTGLDIPTWYNISNSPNTPSVSTLYSLRRLYGVFAQVDLAWMDKLYLTLTARNDWSSTLPSNSNSFFYPGSTLSYIFTQDLPESVNQWLSFGKIRVAYGQTGNDADPYMLYPVFAQAGANSSGWGNVSFPLGGTNAFSLGNTLGNQKLVPQINTEYEFGLNVAFFNGRISLDAAYYNKNSNKQIFSLNMDPATGFTAQTMNLGKIENKGVEVLLSLKPIVTNDFTWEVVANFTKNNSKVITLPEDQGGISQIYGFTGGTSMYAIVGQPLGTYKAQVAKRSPEGKIVVNPSTGLPIASDDFKMIGDMNYDYELGLSTTLTYKSVSLAIDFDIRQGGLMYSRTKAINYFTGNAIQTAYNDRNPFIVPNSVVEEIDANGDVQYVTNTKCISVSDILTYWDNGGTDMGSAYLIDKSYIKLRNLTLSWDFPKHLLAKTPFQAVKLSAYGNNLFMWTPASNTFIDPEMTSFGNDLSGRFGEYTANPTSRRFGINLNVKF